MMNEIQPVQDGGIFAKCKWTATGLELPYNLSYDEWEEVGTILTSLDRAMQWALGDWLNHGEHAFGEKYAQAIEETPYSYGHLRNTAWVARQFEPRRRRPELTFYHHALVAGMEKKDQNSWLTRAINGGWSVNQMRREVSTSRRPELLEEKCMPGDLASVMSRISDAALAGAPIEKALTDEYRGILERERGKKTNAEG